MKTLLLELREAAQACSNVDYRDLLREYANDIASAINRLLDEPTEGNMIELNGLWARADWALKNVPDEGAPAPLAPPMEEQVRMAA